MANIEAFSDDKLDRKAVAENFKNILLNTDLNVFSLVAPWGGGKTYFIQNLIRIMEKDSIIHFIFAIVMLYKHFIKIIFLFAQYCIKLDAFYVPC